VIPVLAAAGVLGTARPEITKLEITSWRLGMNSEISRRDALRLGAVAAGGLAASGVLAACGGSGVPGNGGAGGNGRSGGSGGSGGGNLVFLSDQLSTTEETATMRTQILSGFTGGGVSFTSFSSATQFIDQVVAQAKAGAGNVDLIGGLQGDFVSLAAQIPLRDMSDVVSELAGQDIPQPYLELAKIKGAYRFVPWITATYLMVANKKALQYLPSGANVNSLTYDQLLAWGQELKAKTGQPQIGLPASPDGLIKRFFQGYAYPSFTGGLNTTFKSPAAVSMWTWFKELWAVTNPQSPTYAFMQEPLLSGEVMVAWDHAVRLIDALKNEPDQFVVFPAPSGPKGLGYEPVLGGLAIPTSSKRVNEAKSLISYLLQPKTESTMLSAEAWFPPTGTTALPSGLPTGVSNEAKAIVATTSAPGAIASQLPIGLGAQSSTYDKVFVDTFTAIALNNAPIASTLNSQAGTLQSLLQSAGAACWKPDPLSSGVCQVG
jgi:multiple sugar transport system substrate-binding protein